MNGPLLGREPVATVSTVVALLIAVLPVFGWSTETVGSVAAALVVLGGAVEAALVSVDRLLPLLVGIGKAVLAVVASFGVSLPDNWVAATMAVLTILAGLKVRDQVGAVQPPRDRDGRKLDRMGFPVGVLDTTEPDPETYDPAARGDAHTEVFGAVTADGPVPEHGDQSGGEEREYQPRHGSGYGVRRGRLDPQLGT